MFCSHYLCPVLQLGLSAVAGGGGSICLVSDGLSTCYEHYEQTKVLISLLHIDDIFRYSACGVGCASTGDVKQAFPKSLQYCGLGWFWLL